VKHSVKELSDEQLQNLNRLAACNEWYEIWLMTTRELAHRETDAE